MSGKENILIMCSNRMKRFAARYNTFARTRFEKGSCGMSMSIPGSGGNGLRGIRCVAEVALLRHRRGRRCHNISECYNIFKWIAELSHTCLRLDIRACGLILCENPPKEIFCQCRKISDKGIGNFPAFPNGLLMLYNQVVLPKG